MEFLSIGLSNPNFREIKSIQFGIESHEEIKSDSTCSIEKPNLKDKSNMGTVYDPRMGIVENNEICETCGQDSISCPGHFGVINLNGYIVHPRFVKTVLDILNCVCSLCSKPFISNDEIELLGLGKQKGKDRFAKILKEVDKRTRCNDCGNDKRIYKLRDEKIVRVVNDVQRLVQAQTIYNIFLKIKNEDFESLGFNQFLTKNKKYSDPNTLIEFGTNHRHQNRPEWFLLNVLPVIPTIVRPYAFADDERKHDDLTTKYIEIVKLCQKIANPKPNKKRTPEEDKKRNHQMLLYNIETLFDNKSGKCTTSEGKKSKGLRERFEGKEGGMRLNIQGKRTNYSARGVINVVPFLPMEYITLPVEAAKILTIPVPITFFNINDMQELVKKNNVNNVIRKGRKIMLFDPKTDRCTQLSSKFYKLIDNKLQLQIGDIVERQLRNNDIVVLNRQPTLRKESKQAFKIYITNEHVIRINVSVTSPFGADFDGDEMNIHVPQSITAQTELIELLHVRHQILTPQRNGPCMGLIQDGLLATYIMTKPGVIVNKRIAYDCFTMIKDFNYTDFFSRVKKHYPKFSLTKMSGKILFSALFPANFFYKNNSGVIIENGIILEKSEPLDKKAVGPTPGTVHHYLAIEYNLETAMKFLSEAQYVTNFWLQNEGFSVGIEDCIISNPDKINDLLIKTQAKYESATQIKGDTLEETLSNILNSATAEGSNIVSQSIAKDNAFITMAKSGAKGTNVNVFQISAFLGQQNVDGRRVPLSITGKTRSLVHFGKEDTPHSRGFIVRSYFSGLNPSQLVFHAMAGREGIIDTALKTAKTGYIERRIVKKTEDLKLYHDGTVRNNSKHIVQFLYGDDGMDGTRVFNVMGKLSWINLERVCERFNSESKDKRESIDFDWLFSDLVLNRVRSPIVTFAEKKLFDHLKQKFSKTQICKNKKDELKKMTTQLFYKAICNPGENVGIICASSIGEPTTQSMMKNWDPRLSNNARKTTTGVVRLEELLSATKTKNVKTPSCVLYLSETKGKDNREILRNAYRLRKHMQLCKVSNLLSTKPIMKKVGESVQGSPFSFVKNVVYEEEWWVKVYEELFGLEIHKKDWIIELSFDVEKLYLFEISLETIAQKIVNGVRSIDIECVPSPQILGKIIVHINFSSIDKKNKSLETGRKVKLIDNDNINYYYARDVLIKEIINIKVCGIDGIENVFFEMRKDNGQDIVVIETQGTNLKALLNLSFIDKRRSYSDDMWDTYNTLGIGAARKTIIRELTGVLCSNGTYIDKRHIELLVDSMTHQGIITAVRREGIDKGAGPLARCSFEKTLENFQLAGIYGEKDELNSVSSRIVVGRLMEGGTGFCDLLPNNDMFERIVQERDNTYHYTHESIQKTDKELFMDRLGEWY